ncbi:MULTISPECIES: SUF system Fe-S cluster assembly protein [unclassified Iodidimonas]|jgi:FeS assembly SUF system protein|uniref:SUF system Fe-S cluster assembly protein n=1 Tax=unclassified Iodidimonas TaxID=2626145 RepID=UPI0024828230|nr:MULTISPECIES: SUF system Fe-S cluster assembly protein [unclassified Iodidimonas]
MMDDTFKQHEGPKPLDEKALDVDPDSPEGAASKAERPVWSHKTEDGYLEDFLKADSKADGEVDAPTTESAPAPAQMAEGDLKERVIEALKTIFDPEIPVNIYELGLIYGVAVDTSHNVEITMTLTTPHCPVAESMPHEVDRCVRSVEGVNDVDVDLVWNPPWDMSRMSDEARLELGLL